MKHRRRIAALGAIAALALAGCGTDTDPGTSTEGPTPTRDPLPLDEFWSSMDSGWDPEQAEADQMRIEELVAQCMTEQGFEYTPVVYPMGDAVARDIAIAAGDELDWSSLEFAERYGYGITTNPWEDQEVEPPVVDPPIGEEWVDPNQDYVESMSEAEQQAYWAALYGDQSKFEDFTEEDWENYVWTWEDNGCQGWAQHEINPEIWDEGNDGSQFEALWADMDAMYLSIQEDPRLTAAVDAWSACMAEAGHPGLTDIWSASNIIYEKVEPIWEEVYGQIDYESDAEIDYEALDREVRERLSEFTDLEIEVAVADWHCKDDARYTDIEDEVTREIQQQFIDTHRAELDAYAEWVG